MNTNTYPRGFEVIQEHNLGESFKEPINATRGSAGYDFFNNTGKDIIIEPKNTSEIIRTYIKAFMQDGEVLSIYPRSSLGFKYNTRIVNTVAKIDSDYNREIFIKLYNDSNEIVTIKTGEAFVQGVFEPYLKAWNHNYDNERTGGIGSTTKDTK